jgi:hypothetical protein
MDFCILDPWPFWRILRPMANPGVTSKSFGEQDKIRYGAIAFWAVVAVLMIARVLLLDPSRIHPEQGSGLAPTAGTPITAPHGAAL